MRTEEPIFRDPGRFRFGADSYPFDSLQFGNIRRKAGAL